jgi:hypothetical protein
VCITEDVEDDVDVFATVLLQEPTRAVITEDVEALAAQSALCRRLC